MKQEEKSWVAPWCALGLAKVAWDACWLRGRPFGVDNWVQFGGPVSLELGHLSYRDQMSLGGTDVAQRAM